jgi:hypothetical protein
MPTRKNVFKSIGKRMQKASNARPEKAGKYAARAMMNVGQGTAALASGAGSLLSGDIEGAKPAAALYRAVVRTGNDLLMRTYNLTIVNQMIWYDDRNTSPVCFG